MRLLEIAIPADIAQGHLKDAESLAEEMLDIARNRARYPAMSLDVGEGYLSRAFVLAAERRATEARDAARRAQTVLAAAVGQSHAWTQAASQLASGAEAGTFVPRVRVCPDAPSPL